MAYPQYTQCVKPQDYSGSISFAAAGITIGILTLLTLDLGVATLGAIIAGIAYCRWWLYGRLVCLGGNACTIGLALQVFPPELKTGLNREDTDYSVNLLLAPTTLFEGMKQAANDVQGSLIGETTDPAFQTMMGNFPGLGFTGEPEPFSDLANPNGQSPNAGVWQANNFYLPGAVIQDGNSNLQTCTTQGLSGGNAPNWATQIGQTTADGFINWTCSGRYAVLTQAQLNGIGLFCPGGWTAATAYKAGDLILDGNGFVQSCSTTGISGATATAPAFSTTVDETTTEAGSPVTWVCLGVGRPWASSYHDSASDSWSRTNYKVGGQIVDGNGNLQSCTVAGQSGPVLPNWGTALGATTTDGQVTWTRIANPQWIASHLFRVGAILTDSNGVAQACISPGMSGTMPPPWNDTPGQQTSDNEVTWSCIGQQTTSIGTLEVEFEGAGMYDLYVALLVASPFAAAAAAVGWIPFLGWLLALLLSLIAAGIAGIGYLVGEGDTADPNADDPSIGTISPGVDVLVVMGTWIYDSAHGGWNELHPVLHCQKIATVPAGDLATGNPWANLSQFSAANVEATLGQVTADRTGWCPLIGEAASPLTATAQQEPQNQWSIHPLVDGCTATPPPTPLQ